MFEIAAGILLAMFIITAPPFICDLALATIVLGALAWIALFLL